MTMATRPTIACSTPDVWVLRIPKPRLSALRGLRRWALIALLTGYSATVTAAARGAESTDCDDYAALHYAMSGGQDAAWEDAHAACSAREGTLAQAYAWAAECTTETSWALYLPETDSWRAECGDADGNPVGAP